MYHVHLAKGKTVESIIVSVLALISIKIFDFLAFFLKLTGMNS